MLWQDHIGFNLWLTAKILLAAAAFGCGEDAHTHDGLQHPDQVDAELESLVLQHWRRNPWRRVPLGVGRDVPICCRSI